MRVSTAQSELKSGLAVVIRAVGSKSTLPVLSNILLEARDGSLRIAATDLQVAISHKIAANVEEQGAITVPAKLFSDVINSSPAGMLSLELDVRTQTLKIKAGRFTSNIKGIEAEEFPTVPSRDDAEGVLEIDPIILASAIDRVVVAAARDDSRPVLVGVLFRVRDSTLTLAAADGYRLAISKTAVSGADHVDLIIPAHSIEEAGRALGASTSVIGISVKGDTHVLFSNGTTEVVSRLIDGKFPDFERIVPAQATTRTILDVVEMQRAIKVVAYFAVASQNVVKLTIEPSADGPGRIVISANASEIGDSTGETEGIVHGEGGQIALNVKYLADALGAIKTAQVALETQTDKLPGVLKPVGQEGYVHIVMPMSIR